MEGDSEEMNENDRAQMTHLMLFGLYVCVSLMFYFFFNVLMTYYSFWFYLHSRRLYDEEMN